jgi:hypothetical protein
MNERSIISGSSPPGGKWLDSGCLFSDCKKYRYKLWRVWDTDRPTLFFILMNPSTADETTNDPTIERCERRARSLGYGGLVILNCGGIRETDSRIAWSDPDPIGPDNLKVIANELVESRFSESFYPTFAAGWGTPARRLGADLPVLELFRGLRRPLYCLGVNADGSPKHPLYVPYSKELELYEGIGSL